MAFLMRPPDGWSATAGMVPVLEIVDGAESIAPVPMNSRLPLAEIEDEDPVIAPMPENLREPLAAIVDGVDARDPLPVKDTPPSCDSNKLMV